jgi:Uma2 family endonuclease
MAISAKTYEQVALEDDDELWELDCGRLRRKPPMTADHNEEISRIWGRLFIALDEDEYAVRSNSARLRIATGAFYIPDVCVVTRAMFERVRAERPRGLESYEELVPLVVEVWSPSTGEYDVEVKLAAYKQRGDHEIWRVHPIERTVTVWRRRADGGYDEQVYREGEIAPVALPGVRIAIAQLFG